jgi:alanyl-tRNA synthetase
VIRDVAGLVRAGRDDLPDKVAQLLDRTRQLEREIEQLRGRIASGTGRDLLEQVREVGGVKVLAARVDGADAKSLREAADRLKDRIGSGVVVLGAVEDDKVRLVAGVTSDLTHSLKAGELIGPVAEHVGGRGGGRADFAQAGGNDPARLDEALAMVTDAVAARLDSA